MIWKEVTSCILWMGSLLLFAVCGCVSVDRWTVFTPEYAQVTSRGEDALVRRDSGRLTPTMAKEPKTVVLPAGERLRLSLEQATMLAIRNNSDLKVQQFAPVITGTFERIERGRFDPEILASLTYTQETAEEVSQDSDERYTRTDTDVSAAAGIRQELPTGTTLEAGVTHNRNRSDHSADEYDLRAGLTVTQSLLQGLGPAVQLAGVRQAELGTLVSLYELQGFTEALVAGIETAYWEYVLAQQEIAIFQRSLTVSRQQRDEVEEQIEVGILPRTEAAAARAEVARREQALIDARSLMQQRRLRLLRLITSGRTEDWDRQVEALSQPAITPDPITNEAERVDLAARLRSDLREARLRMEQGRLETVVTRNGLLPKLDLFMTVGRTGYGDSLADSFRHLDANTRDMSAGLSLRHFLGDRAAKARHEAAWAGYEQAFSAVDNLRQQVGYDVRQAVNEVERARRQITASRATRRFEEQTVRAEKERFRVGASTALLVAQAQRDLLASQIEEVRAVIQYRIALIDLYVAEGSLLQRRGITVGNTGN